MTKDEVIQRIAGKDSRYRKHLPPGAEPILPDHAASKGKVGQLSLRKSLKVIQPCQYEGTVVKFCHSCKGENRHVRYCEHPSPSDSERVHCTREECDTTFDDQKVQACENCPDRVTVVSQQFNSRITAEERDKLYRLLSTVGSTLSDMGVEYCLFAGSLLGYVHVGDILPWDDDVDLLVLGKLDVDLLRERLPGLGVSFNGRVARVFDPNDPIPDGTTQPFPFLDLDCTARIHDGFLYETDHNTDKTQDYSLDDVLPTKRGKFGPIESVSIPFNPKAMVIAKYGPDCLSSAVPPMWSHRNDKPTGYAAKRVAFEDIPSLPKNYEWVSTSDLARDSMLLAGMLPLNASAIAGVPRSGLITASIIATQLHLPLYEITEDGMLNRLGHGSRGRIPGLSGSKRGPIVVVDDTVYSGSAMRKARSHMRELRREAVFAAVYCKPEALSAVDYHVRALPSPHILEWNVASNGPVAGHAANPIYGDGVAFDIDGIIVHDQESGGKVLNPYLIPRAFPAPLLVTGRRESSRKVTEELLAKIGAKYDRLVMLPDNDPGTTESIAAHKAKHYSESECGFFLESCPLQAKLIHSLSKKPVICPIAQKVWA